MVICGSFRSIKILCSGVFKSVMNSIFVPFAISSSSMPFVFSSSIKLSGILMLDRYYCFVMFLNYSFSLFRSHRNRTHLSTHFSFQSAPRRCFLPRGCRLLRLTFCRAENSRSILGTAPYPIIRSFWCPHLLAQEIYCKACCRAL